MYKNFLTLKIRKFVVKQMKKQIKEANCKEYLVVRNGKFFIEMLDVKGNLHTLPVTFNFKDSNKYLEDKLHRNFNTKSGKFPLRRFTQKEQIAIQNSDMHKCPGTNSRDPALQKMLDCMIENTFILELSALKDREIFEKNSKGSVYFMEGSWIFNGAVDAFRA